MNIFFLIYYKSTKRFRSIYSFYYLYFINLKIWKIWLRWIEKKEIAFHYLNIIDFKIVTFALIIIKNTLKEKYISLMKNDSKNRLYEYLQIIFLLMILKYYIFSMKILEVKMYKITITILILFVLIFNLHSSIK